MSPSWQDLARTKREAILSAIPSKWHLDKIPAIEDQLDVSGEYIRQFLTEKEVEITETDAVGIVNKIAKGEWKSVDVVEAFCHRAALGHQLLNCLHEVFFDAALADARALDDYYAQHGKTKGPLHGLPVSLKDQFHVKGVETTMGYVGWIDTFEGKKGTGKEKVFESVMVKELRDAGAVLFCKTSVPHTLMVGETVNNIIDYTVGGKNRRLTAGGSSGGEGALIGVKGSPLGFGTDIGGSVRIPSAFNGLYGLRPSIGRIPYQGMANSMDGQNSILSVVGPLATTAPSLRLAMTALLAQNPWLHDPFILEIPWRENHEEEIRQRAAKGALRFGFMKTDGQINPHPPVTRALEQVVAKLQEAGHKVIDWKPTVPHEQILDAVQATWIFDGGNDIKSAFALSGEPMSPHVESFSKLEKEMVASEIAAVNVKLRELRKEYLDYWVSTADEEGTMVDAVICPVAPFVAPTRGMNKYYGYTWFVNGLDFTGVVVPVTEVDKAVDGAVKEYQALNELDAEVQGSYDAEVCHGAHVCVQLVGRRLQEEKMVAIAEYVGKLLGK